MRTGNIYQKIRVTLTFTSFFISTFLFISCNWNSTNKNDPEKSAGKESVKDSTHIVDVKAVDYAFAMPTEIPSGWVTFRMENLGKEVHHGVIAKFIDTLSYAQLSQMIGYAIEESTPEAYDPIYAVMEKDYGGPAMLSPGLSGETTVYLEPGLYTLSCHLRTAEGEFHKNKGMNRPFVVTEKKAGTEKPITTVDLTLSNFAIEVGPIGSGEQVFNVNYEDYDYHNVHLSKLEDDQEIEELKVWMTKAQMPSPFTFIGGAEQVPVGQTSTFKATLEPGRYAFVAYGQSIAGMAAEITVPEDGKSQPVSHEMVNQEVMIELDLDQNVYPKEIPVGRTPVVISNQGEHGSRYMLALLKKESTIEEFENYVVDVIVNERADPQERIIPFYQIWTNVLSPGEKERFNLKVEEREYVLVGPINPDKPLKSQWREKNLIYSFNGISEN